MQSFLLIGDYQKAKDQLIADLNCKVLHFDIQKIADIRDLSKTTRLTLNTKTAIVIANFDHVTPEAQNAFLKELEEPQKDLYYILTADKTDTILETIISRCQVITTLKTHTVSKDTQTDIANFITSSQSSKLLFTSKIKDRPKAIEFLNNLLLVIHKLLLENPNKKYAQLLTQTQKTLTRIEKHNANVQLQLTNFVISTPSLDKL